MKSRAVILRASMKQNSYPIIKLRTYEVYICVWGGGDRCDKVTSNTNFLLGEVWSHLNIYLLTDNFIFRGK